MGLNPKTARRKNFRCHQGLHRIQYLNNKKIETFNQVCICTVPCLCLLLLCLAGGQSHRSHLVRSFLFPLQRRWGMRHKGAQQSCQGRGPRRGLPGGQVCCGLPPPDLEDGVLLCQLLERCGLKLRYRSSARKLGIFHCRDNVAQFLDKCRQLEALDAVLFNPGGAPRKTEW